MLHNHESLSELTDLLLLAGSLLMTHGAPSQQVHDTMVRIGEKMGCQKIEAVVDYDHLIVTLTCGTFNISRIKSLNDLGVNFFKVAAVGRLCRAFDSQVLSLYELRVELQKIEDLKHPCPIWGLPLLSGVGCAAVGQIFGADVYGFGVDILGAFGGCIVFILTLKSFISPYVTTFLSALMTGLIINICVILNLTQTVVPVLSASVLYLVPGVAMICGVLDVVCGHISAGYARLVNMCVVSLSIALGLLTAIKFTDYLWNSIY